MHFSKRLFSFTKGSRTKLALALVLGLLTASAGVSRLALSGYAISLVFQDAPTKEVVYTILGVVGSILFRSIFQYFKEMLGHQAAARTQLKMRTALYHQALVLGPGALDQKRAGDVLVSLVEGVDQLETYFGEYLPQLAVAALTPIGIFIFMAFLDVPTASIYLGFALFTLTMRSVFHHWNAKSSMTRRKAYGDLSADYLDSVQGLFTLKAFGQSRARGNLLSNKAWKVYRDTMGILAMNTGTTGVTWLGITAGTAVALTWGAYRVEDGTMGLAPLLIIVMLGVEVFRPLRELTVLYHKGMLGMSAATAVFDLLDSRPAVIERSAPQFSNEDLEPTLQFDQVTFTYPAGRSPALRNVSFEIRSGERLGIVGRSGAGKSTLVGLALRFFDPDGGRVLLGGKNLMDMSLSKIREQMAVVAQDTYLFYSTVEDNIRLGRPNADSEQIENAARLANAHEFISGLPSGYKTIIGERGIRLSTGQRQRIAIARAILKDAPILLLDEALSSVDTENEFLIQEALTRLMVGRTTIVIAHRLSSVINADRILILDEGRLVEEGTHKNLLAHGGVYSTLMEPQLVYDLERGALEHSVPYDPTKTTPMVTDVAQPQPDAPVQGTQITSGIIGEGPGIMMWHQVFRRLLWLVAPRRNSLILSFLLGVLRVLVLIGMGVTSALIVREIASGQNNDMIWLVATLGALSISTPLLHWGESWVSHDMAFRLLAEMRNALYAKLDDVAPAFLVKRRSGDITGIVTADIETIENFFAHTIAPAFVAVTVPLAIFVTLAFFQWPMALTLMPFLLLVSLTPLWSRKALGRIALASRTKLGEINAHMIDAVQGMREIVAFGSEGATLAEVADNQRIFSNYRLIFFKHLTLQRVTIETCIGLGGLAVLSMGAYLVMQGQLAVTILPLLSLLALASFIPISEVVQVFKQLADTLASSRRIFAVHDEVPSVEDGSGVDVAGSTPDTGRSIDFQNVSFSYSQDRSNALKGVSFTVAAGQTVALVGRSGAGKTTSAHLILRFWDPTEGNIFLDGHNIKDFRLDDLRRNVALVSQDVYLFNTTIKDNLKIAKPDATDSEIAVAAQKANAHEFIEPMPLGYETLVGERGVQLSGGQRQRIAIARAVLKAAPVLVLDEATSHLDAINERLVRQALANLMKNRTTLVIAHRLSTIREADNILVLDDGKLVEEGRHEDLLSKGGLYKHLISSQVTGGPHPRL